MTPPQNDPFSGFQKVVLCPSDLSLGMYDRELAEIRGFRGGKLGTPKIPKKGGRGGSKITKLGGSKNTQIEDHKIPGVRNHQIPPNWENYKIPKLGTPKSPKRGGRGGILGFLGV